MPEQTAGSTDAEPALRSLADKVNWLIDRARPAGRGSWSNAEVADLIERTTGERVSYTTIWKLRNGQTANPQMKLIEAMARTFGVQPGANLEAMMGMAVRAAARPGQRRLVYRCAALADVAAGLVTGCLGAVPRRNELRSVTAKPAA